MFFKNKDENRHMSDALQCIASLIKISNKFDHISVSYVQKTAQKQPKIVLSVGMKLFEISKLENYLINFVRTPVICLGLGTCVV